MQLNEFNKIAQHNILVEEIEQSNDTGYSSEDLAMVVEAVQEENFTHEFDASKPDQFNAMLDWVFEGFGIENDGSWLDEEFEGETLTEEQKKWLAEAKKNRNVDIESEPEVQNSPEEKKRKVIFRYADLHKDTEKKYRDKVQVPKKFARFAVLKNIDPNSQISKDDTALTGDGSPLKKLGIMHAPLTDDIKVFYRVEPHPKVKGATAVNIYGFYSHDDAGTAPGKAANHKKQEALANRISNVDKNERFDAEKEVDEKGKLIDAKY